MRTNRVQQRCKVAKRVIWEKFVSRLTATLMRACFSDACEHVPAGIVDEGDAYDAVAQCAMGVCCARLVRFVADNKVGVTSTSAGGMRNVTRQSLF